MKLARLLLAGALLAAAPVQAQDTPAQPPTGGTSDTGSTGGRDQGDMRSVVTDVLGSVLTGPSWNLGISIFGGYNQTNVSSTNAGTGALASFIRSGSTAGATTQLSTYSSFRRINLGFGGGTSTSYFRATDRLMTSFNGRLSQSITLGRRTTLSAGESITYTPYYALNQFVGLQNFAGTQLTVPTQGTFDMAIGDMHQYRYTGLAQLNHPITDRTDVSASYSADISSLNSAKPDRVYQQAGFRMSHMLSAGFGYHLGYSYGQATFQGVSDPTAFHNIDVGLNMNRALSITRRTTFSFSTGTTLNRNRSEAAGGTSTTTPATPPDTRTYFNVIGQANLTHNIGRSWNARVNYSRTWQMIDGSYVPFLGDTASAGISGNVGKNTTLGSSVSFLLGGPQASGTAGQRQAISMNTFFNFRLKTALSGFVQYGYYRQQFDLSQTGLNLPRDFSRNSVRAGLTLSLRSR